jgi:DNA-binding MarR family transcriptional regulator
MSASKKQRFAPLPLRACRDLRLGALHFRVLTAIAAFDRLGKNGQGCWTSQNKIAELVRCSKSHLSNVLSDLRDCGYLTSKINPDQQRFRVHRIVYTEEDFHCLDMGKSVHSRANKLVHSRVNHSAETTVHSSEASVHSGVNSQFTTPLKKTAKSMTCKT